jgi:hypothetical protein
MVVDSSNGFLMMLARVVEPVKDTRSLPASTGVVPLTINPLVITDDCGEIPVCGNFCP